MVEVDKLRRNRARQVLVVCASMFLFRAVLAFAEANREASQLKSTYKGKLLTFRHFYEGEHLHFGPDGELVP
jgi:hypothetical protein